MKTNVLFAGVVVLCLITAGVYADGLIVYGSDFAFTVVEPKGWKGDIDSAADYEANIVFYRKTETPANANAFIYIAVFDKESSTTLNQVMQTDMQKCQKEFPGIKFQDFPTSHPHYKFVSKLFSRPDGTKEYVTYLDPVPPQKLRISVSMNKKKEAADKTQMGAYQEIIRSIMYLKRTRPKP